MGANIRDRGTCGMFQSAQLTYRDVLRSGEDEDEDEDEDQVGSGPFRRDEDGDGDEDGDEDGDLLYSGDLMYSGDLNIGKI